MNKGTAVTAGVPKAPGMKYRHYAPSAPVYIVDREEDFNSIPHGNNIGIVALDSVLDKIEAENKFSLGKTIDDAAHNLFGALRFFDNQTQIKEIYVQGFDQGDISPAYMNRLNKSAAGHHFHD